jgi:hypothetical protein
MVKNKEQRMNERIQALAKGAKHAVEQEGIILELALEKFAELIVRECVQTLIDNTPERYTNESAEEDWDKGYDRAMRDCVHHIQEHFGVEESLGWVCSKCGTDRTKAVCPLGHSASVDGRCPMVASTL